MSLLKAQLEACLIRLGQAILHNSHWNLDGLLGYLAILNEGFKPLTKKTDEKRERQT